jgi:para-nitrobenzyl esterase
MNRVAKLLASGAAGVLLTACATTEATTVAPPAVPPAGPQVTVNTGTLEGVRQEAIEAFKGIPYAAPPVGPLRWAPPKSAAAWAGVRVAKEVANDCMQTPFPGDMAPLRTKPSEDCLYLNVWRPAGSGAKLPVMVWIHGGGFVNGGGSPAVYDGSNFARDGVILVSINYRLGRFGFFGFPALTANAKDEPVVNYGYMDQIAALKWVKANIAAFGGDPDNVTIFGESAGGGSVHTLLASPLAKGLFAKAIVESGGGRGNLMGDRQASKDLPNLPSADTIGVNFAKASGIEGTDDAALAALRALPAEKVCDGLSMMARNNAGPVTYGGPVMDGKVVVMSPEKAYTSGQFNKVPFMAGANSADIGFGMAKTMDEALAPFGAKNKAKALAAYDAKGTGNVALAAMKIAMDRMMIEPARFAVRAFEANGLPSFEYRFSYVAPAAAEAMAKNPMMAMMKDNAELMDFVIHNAQHASEIPYVFETVTAAYGAATSDKDIAVARSAHRYWVNFAKTGNPSEPALLGGDPNWPVYNTKQDVLLDFTQDGAKAVTDPMKARMDLTAGRKN